MEVKYPLNPSYPPTTIDEESGEILDVHNEEMPKSPTYVELI